MTPVSTQTAAVAISAAAVAAAAPLEAVSDALLQAVATVTVRMIDTDEPNCLHRGLKLVHAIATGPCYPLALSLQPDVAAAAAARLALAPLPAASSAGGSPSGVPSVPLSCAMQALSAAVPPER